VADNCGVRLNRRVQLVNVETLAARDPNPLLSLSIPAWRITDFLCPELEAHQRRMKILQNHLGAFVLTVSGLLGMALIAAPLWWHWERDHGIVVAIGTALLIAPIVAVGIEQWMTKRIARDVFRAAFGYHFPEDFKTEIARIASHSVICTRHIMDVRLRALDTESVLVIVTVERHFQNISANEESHAALVWIDEWGFPEKKSKIIRCDIFDGNGTLSKGFDEDEIEYLPNLSLRFITPKVALKRNGTCSSIIEYIIVRRRNDFIYEQFSSPTRNPEIRIIEKPDDIEVTADFGGGKLKPAHLPYRYELDGVYFAPAPMKVRWWPKTASENWPSSSARVG
jgi:hypothetical protein